MFITTIYSQNNIVASGNECYTIGEIFPIMQQNLKEKEVSLGVPVFEIPKEKPKTVKKKLTFWEKLLKLLGL